MNSQKIELTGIVGSGDVFDELAVLESYSKDASFCSPMRPRLLVKVSSVDHVQEIAKWANKTNTPLIPVSSDPPHYKGDTVTSVPEAVIIDLSGMKKIIRYQSPTQDMYYRAWCDLSRVAKGTG